jgi:hypothetical protein
MVVIELLNHFFHPSGLFVLNQVMVSFLIVSFLFFGKLRSCSFPDRLSPIPKFHSLWLLLCVVDSFHEFKGAVAGNPEMASLVFEKFKVLMRASPGFRTNGDCGQNGAFVVFNCGGPVGVPVGVCEEPRVLRRFGRKISPSNGLNGHSAYLRVTK